jgi:hypothetical protein
MNFDLQSWPPLPLPGTRLLREAAAHIAMPRSKKILVLRRK